jgi:polyhydroxyalkanoate synthesis repressor PhaR
MSEPRIIKRYTNRKLYDTKDSRYVTLSQIAGMVRAGEEMTVVDNATKEDLTSLTLAQIIYEQEKRQAEVLPLSALRELVRRSEARLADLREGRVGRLLVRGEPDGGAAGAPEPDDAAVHKGPERAVDVEAEAPGSEPKRGAFEDWQRRVDERLHALLDGLAPFRQLQDEILGVTQRIEELEGRLRNLATRRRDQATSARHPAARDEDVHDAGETE